MIEIKHHFTGAVLFKSEVAETVKAAVIEAIKSGADLRDAYLRDAYLRGAYLGDAYLGGADLGGANLRGADLRDAYLRDAYLRGADLGDAYLGGADLRGANLRGADLRDADLGGADLRDADLRGADLRGADLGGADLGGADLGGARNVPADLANHTDPEKPYERGAVAHDFASRAKRYRERHPEVPVVENLDQRIHEAVTSGDGKLDMSDWHKCETTHCRAGWAVHLAGEAGYALEWKLGGAEYAGRAIYRASTGRAPYFFDTTERALADIKRCAAEVEPVAS